jgi:glycoprotein endo-alpha-1,2-mannosidase
MLRFFIVILVSFGLLSGCGGGGGSGSGESGVAGEGGGSSSLLGAHYYHWFPQNFPHGYLRGTLAPQQEPLLGEYNSNDPRVAAQHIEWASSAGIDFFTLDWWPTRPQQNAAIDRGFLKAPNLSKMKFCIFYESGDLGFSPSVGGIVFGPEEVDRFVSDMTTLAARYFSHPQYLKIGGKPMVVLYITRTFVGAYPEAIRKARAAVKELGFDLFLVGDEIFWSVTAANRNDVVISQDPQVDRIRLFDGITTYNLYENAIQSHSGYMAQSQFIPDVNAIFERYREAAGDVPLLPGIIPGYNDRGVRPRVNHYAIPRQYEAGGSSTSTLEEMYQQVLLPNLDNRVPIGFITSWNEWNEDSAIEPSGPIGSATRNDSSGSANFFTQGYLYEGVGTGYLDLLRRLRGK